MSDLIAADSFQMRIQFPTANVAQCYNPAACFLQPTKTVESRKWTSGLPTQNVNPGKDAHLNDVRESISLRPAPVKKHVRQRSCVTVHYLADHKYKEATEAFQRVVDFYPHDESAAKSKEYLGKLKQHEKIAADLRDASLKP